MSVSAKGSAACRVQLHKQNGQNLTLALATLMATLRSYLVYLIWRLDGVWSVEACGCFSGFSTVRSHLILNHLTYTAGGARFPGKVQQYLPAISHKMCIISTSR
jgi:hypothetical protein